MKKSERARLKALLALDATKLSADESTELKSLQEKAVKFPKEDEDEDDDDKGAKKLSDEEVSALVGKALTKTLEAAGLSQASIIAEVKKLHGEPITAKRIEEIVKATAGESVDVKTIVEELRKALPENVSEDRIKAIFTEAFASQREASKMEHGFDFPISHRSGNLSVAQKQLLNLCLNPGVTGEKAIEACMNTGITEGQLKQATTRGERMLKSMRDSARYGEKLTAAGVGTGAELLAHDLSSDLQRRLYLESKLATALISSEIAMPTNPFLIPMLTTRPDFYVTGETQATLNSDVGTAQPTLNAVKLTGRVPYSYESDEGLSALTQQYGKLRGQYDAMIKVLENTQADRYEKFTCFICQDRLVDLFIDPCGHVVCEPCWVRTRDHTKCPGCRVAVAGARKIFSM